MSGFGLNQATVTFGQVHALESVSLDAPAGEVTCVIGGDGAGKSTLLRVLAHRVPLASGSVSSTDERSLGYQPSTSGVWNDLTVTENLQFVGRAYGMSAKAIAARSADLLHTAGLEAATDRTGRHLSGGMRQKLGFLLAILHSPTLVLLDEPSTGVDPVSRVDLWRLISATAVGGTAVVMTTTYLDEAARAATVTALDGGRVIASGTPSDVISSVPGTIVESPVDEVTPDSWRRGPTRHRWVGEGKASHGVAVSPDLDDALIALTLAHHPQEREAPSVTVKEPSAAGSPLKAGTLVAAGRKVTRTFGSFTAVDDVTLEVKAGEIVGLIGANGAGKTTFIRSLIGLDAPTSGSVELFGKAPGDAARERLGYVPQGLGLYQTITVAENVVKRPEFVGGS